MQHTTVDTEETNLQMLKVWEYNAPVNTHRMHEPDMLILEAILTIPDHLAHLFSLEVGKLHHVVESGSISQTVMVCVVTQGLDSYEVAQSVHKHSSIAE
jgi:hypothetical protein